MLELARSELGGPALAGATDALSETQENLGFALGGRRPAARATPEARLPRMRTQLQQMVRNVPATAKTDEVRRHLSGLEEVSEIIEALERDGHDAGEAALLLATLLESDNLSPARREQLEKALGRITAQDDWALKLFGRLELGPTSPHSFVQLKQLYQRATSRRTRLVQWFEEFRQLPDRQRKLKALIRTLAFELSAEGPATHSRLGAVISDLKRILLFLGMEDHCHRAARTLDIDGVDGDALVQTLLEIIQQPWMQVDWVTDLSRQQVADPNRRYAYVQQLLELGRLMVEDCFEDAEQRNTILDALREARERLADEGL